MKPAGARRRAPSSHVALGLAAVAALAVCGCDFGSLGSLLDRRGNPSALWDIVSTCVDPSSADPPASACSCPAFALTCCGDPRTPTDAVLWAESPDFVAIRDLKACGCPPDFVAALALPRARVSGIEDPHRPEGIWPFAWKVARAHIADEFDIGLVINPRDARSQDQMHVHLLRLKPGIRAQLDAAVSDREDSGLGRAWVTRVADLDHVFAAALAHAGEAAIANTGVLVARARAGGYLVVVTSRTSPQAFTVNRCG